MYRVAVVGATGFAGQELVRLLARHPGVRLTVATASHATSTPRKLPALSHVWEGQVEPLDRSRVIADAEVAFLALPEAASAEIAPSLVEAGLRVIDLSGAFRLRSGEARARWYPATTSMPDGVAYGLTEFEREAIAGARLLSNPGCYPTASLLALMPLMRDGLITANGDVVIDAKSGISGAGKVPSERTHFSENHGSVAGVRRLRSSSHAGDGAGARADCDVRAASGAARSRDSCVALRQAGAGTTRRRTRQGFSTGCTRRLPS